MVSAPPLRLAAILVLMLAFSQGATLGQDPPSYGCPMHPEMRSLSPGTCARCGMTLIPMGPLGLPPYRVALDTMPRQVKPRETVRLQFAITHPTTGARVKDLGIVHDMPFHLFIVSDDLDYYDHIHPAQDEDGAFVVDTSFPKAGDYHLFCDFVPIGGTPQVVHLHLATAGTRSAAPALRPKLVPDTRLSKTVDGIRFDLTLEPPKVAAGRAAALSYHLSDATTGAPVADLEPYLGAWGHTLILSDDAERYLHCHPTQLIPPGADRTTLSGGPDVAFNATIRQPGVHRLWSQFKRGGKVTTVSFTIDVARLEHLATWNGTAWSATGPASSAAFDGPVRALAVRGSELFAGGDFQTAGGQGAAGIARWDGRRWQPLGEGVDGTVRAIAIAGNDVYVGGEFRKAGGVAAHAIARWDGRTWSALGSGMSGAKDTARPTAVYAIAVSGRDVFVGGRFVTAGDVPANGIARWDGTRFTPLGGGLASGDFDGVVWAMAFFRNELYVGGQFLTAGGVAARNIARWDGHAFAALGAGVAGGLERVAALAAADDRLYVGGDFTVAGDTAASQVASWDGRNWQPVSIRTSESVRAIATRAAEVYVAGGSFTTKNGGKTNGIVRWDGTAWLPLGDGLGSGTFLAPVLSIAPGRGAVHIGGGPFIVR